MKYWLHLYHYNEAIYVYCPTKYVSPPEAIHICILIMMLTIFVCKMNYRHLMYIIGDKHVLTAPTLIIVHLLAVIHLVSSWYIKLQTILPAIVVEIGG